MTTGTVIIQKALRERGAHSVVSTAEPEEISEGRDKLNAMLQSWQSKDIKFSYTPLDAPGDELGEPADTTNAIIYNLAINFGPSFNAPISVELRGLAFSSFNDVRIAYEDIEVPKRVPTSTLPRGAGHSNGLFDRTFVVPGENYDA